MRTFIAVMFIWGLHLPLLSNEKSKPLQGVLFTNGKSFQPWKMYIGNPKNWMQYLKDLSGNTRAPKNVIVSAEKHKSGVDLLKVEWKDSNLGQLMWQAEDYYDFSYIAEQGGALMMILRVDKAPADHVSLRMDCGYPCKGAIKIGDFLKHIPDGQWLKLGVPLKCFDKAGANIKSINTPFVMITKSEMTLTFADVRIEKNVSKNNLIQCE